MSLYPLLKAEFKLVYGELFRRKSAFIAMIIYPYLFAGFTLFFGYTIGSPNLFIERVGIDPVIFMITASYIVMSITAVIDDVLWRPLSDTYIGTIPYILASPVNRLKLFIAIPIPRLLAMVSMGFTSITPIYVLYHGFRGAVTALLIMALVALGALSMVSIAIIIAGLVHTISESWRILNIVRPLMMVLLGAYYPRIFMPFAAYAISFLIPSSHIVEVIHRLFIGSLDGIYISLAIAITLALLYMPGGRKSLLYWERRKVAEGVKTY